jgi:putative membrane protein
MNNAILSFVEYLGTAVVLLAIFVYIYARAAPYKEFALIQHDNIAVAITFAGAVLGFTIPMVAAIYYTHSLIEMIVWAAITCLVQLAVLLALRSQARRIEEGHVSSAIMVATFSVAIGLLNAVSIST